MDMTTDYRYYVVEFSDPPYSEINQYVCIPNSWIQLREIAEQVVVAKYPVEKSSKTKKRVKRGEACEDDWSIYVADVKYGTDSYEEGKKYIKKLEKRVFKNRSSIKQTKDDKLQKRKRNLQLRIKIDESKVSVTPLDNNIESILEEPPVTDPKIEIHKKQTNVVETANSSNEVTKEAHASSKSLNDKQLPSTSENSLDPNSIIRKNYSNKSNNVDTIDTNDNPGGKTGNKSSVNRDFPELTNESSDPRKIREPASDTGNSCLVKECDFIKVSHSLLSQLHTALVENCTILKNMMTFLNNHNTIASYNPIDISSNDTTAPVTSASPVASASLAAPAAAVVEETKSEEETEEETEKYRKNRKDRKSARGTRAATGALKRKAAESEEEENHDNEDFPKRKPYRYRKFTFPPDYDENDSKWTMRYRDHAPGLVELVEHTGVYINAVRLINCKRLAKDAKTLARLLLVEIFTESALSTCSLTGARAKVFDIDGSNIRPGLDENARTVLLTYVDEYAQNEKWPRTDTASILNSIRNKMQEMRHKYG